MLSLKGSLIFLNLFKKAKLLPWRIILTVFFALSAVGYALNGWDISQRICSGTTQGEAERMVEEMKRSNPALASEINRLQSQFGSTALACKMTLDAQTINQYQINYWLIT